MQLILQKFNPLSLDVLAKLRGEINKTSSTLLILFVEKNYELENMKILAHKQKYKDGQWNQTARKTDANIWEPLIHQIMKIIYKFNDYLQYELVCDVTDVSWKDNCFLNLR